MKLKTIFLISIFLFSVLFVSLVNAKGEYGEGVYGTDMYGSESLSTTGSNSGGGGGSPTFRPDENKLKEGYNNVMSKHGEIQFKINNDIHTLKLVDISQTNTHISISSEIQEATLEIGEEKKFELSGDTYYDLLVKLNSISAAENSYLKANFTLQTILEKIPFQGESEREEKTETIISEQEHESENGGQIISSQQKSDAIDNSKDNREKLTYSVRGLSVLILIIIVLIIFKVRNRDIKK